MTGESGSSVSDPGGSTGENGDAQGQDADQCPLCGHPRHAHARIVVNRSEVQYVCDVNTTGVGGPAFDTTGDWGVPP